MRSAVTEDPSSTGPATRTKALPDGAGDARAWVRILAQYREPSTLRSAYELAVTLLPFAAIWALAWYCLSISYLLAAVLSVANAAFLVRLFVVQHDCGHGSFFRSRALADWIGRGLGVLTLTPYDVWKYKHALHHASAGNLDERGIGDITTLTVEEYRALTPFGRFRYRLYRNPLILFCVGPFYLFFIENRLPVGVMRKGERFWISAMGTNVALAAGLTAVVVWGGFAPLLLVYLPTAMVGACIGVWLFYVQHQFEETHWDREEDWNLQEAALHGSSHYVLPGVLRWLSANIGIHHVHHLQSRVPFYRLPTILRDHPSLNEVQRLTLLDSLRATRLHLWDGKSRRLVSFAEARAIQS